MPADNRKPAFSRPLRAVLLSLVSLLSLGGGFLVTQLLLSPEPRDGEGFSAIEGESHQPVDGRHAEEFDRDATSDSPGESPLSAAAPGAIRGELPVYTVPDSERVTQDTPVAGGRDAVPTGFREPTAEPGAEQFAAQMTIADEHLQSGNVARAYDILHDLRVTCRGPVPPALRFRLGLAAEAFGDYSSAMQLYQDLLSQSPGLPWSAVASLGWARCLDALGRQDVLTRQFIAAAVLDDSQLPRVARLELTHLLGRSLAAGLPEFQNHDLLRDDVLALPQMTVNTIDTLDLIRHCAQSPASPERRQICQVLQSLGSEPDSTFLRVHLSGVRAADAAESLCATAGFRAAFSDGARHALATRTVTLHTEDRSLSLLLDGLTLSHGLTWMLDGDQFRFATPDEVGWQVAHAHLKASAERIQRHALMEAPESPHAGHTRIALGFLQFAQGRVSDAAHTFSVQLESQPFAAVRCRTAFNLGKCQLQLHDSQAAKQSFLTAIDSALSHLRVKIAAHLYAGRLQIEQGDTQAALTTLRRALSLANGTEFEAEAALTLSSAYLLVDSPHGANAVLMERRDLLRDEPWRSPTAFLSALSRFRAAVLPDRREREARTLVTALSRFRPSARFGHHWHVLTAEGCEDLGLDELARQHWHQALDSLQDVALRHHVVMRLADSYRDNHDYQTANDLLSLLPTETADHTADLALLRTAELAHLQGRDAEVVRSCHTVLQRSRDETLRRRALRMLGLSYERTQNHQAAVYCFAGMLPEAIAAAAAAPPDEQGPQP